MHFTHNIVGNNLFNDQVIEKSNSQAGMNKISFKAEAWHGAPQVAILFTIFALSAGFQSTKNQYWKYR